MPIFQNIPHVSKPFQTWPALKLLILLFTFYFIFSYGKILVWNVWNEIFWWWIAFANCLSDEIALAPTSSWDCFTWFSPNHSQNPEISQDLNLRKNYKIPTFFVYVYRKKLCNCLPFFSFSSVFLDRVAKKLLCVVGVETCDQYCLF